MRIRLRDFRSRCLAPTLRKTPSQVSKLAQRSLNTMGVHFADDILIINGVEWKFLFFFSNFTEFVPKSPIDNKSALVYVSTPSNIATITCALLKNHMKFDYTFMFPKRNLTPQHFITLAEPYSRDLERKKAGGFHALCNRRLGEILICNIGSRRTRDTLYRIIIHVVKHFVQAV